MKPRAILSVYDKMGLVGFGKQLAKLGFELVASGGTARTLRDAGLIVRDVSAITGAPEMLGGRVKTLHPAVHGGILARDIDSDQDDLDANGIKPIDMVVCNLYPFSETVSKSDSTLDEAIEQIDIGGVTLLRAAAKNFQRVTVVTDPLSYGLVLKELKEEGAVSLATRQQLALAAFKHTRDYDTAISTYLGAQFSEQDENQLAPELILPLKKRLSLRYGENPHQAGAYFSVEAGGPLGGKLLRGKPLSYNNLLDCDAAWRAVESYQSPTVVIIKHLSPCGIASAETLGDAFPLALASDPISAFGSVIAVNRPVDTTFTQEIEAAKLFVEVMLAPSFSKDAVDYFASKKKNCRLIEMGDASSGSNELELRSIKNGFLIQQRDQGDPSSATWDVVSDRPPTAAESLALKTAWQAVQHVKSNAIVFAVNRATVGIGGGLTSRVDAVELAAKKAGDRARGAVMASVSKSKTQKEI